MITHIDGRLVEKTPTYVVIDCGGVGYYINISLNTYSRLPEGERCKLYTHLAIREDAHILFGFIDNAERQLFMQLTSVSGVGPSTARMILSSLGAKEIIEAVTHHQPKVLQGCKGVGAKTAELIVVTLKDKLTKEMILSGGVTEMFAGATSPLKDEALSALVMLGFVKNVADKALDKVIKASGEALTVEQLIKLALKNI
ncbi:MAG: Holliday junction branch migration protein RuvA [Bacteroidia bacterium]|nr:Holliday junction branch migration protein RuvA [Bacteroidia bacterium]